MYRRTFEVLAKYIAKEHNITIAFDSPQGTNVDLEHNTLHLPEKIADEKALSALALIMHEAAHIANSKILPTKEICKTKADFAILNAIEDVRIDRINFELLPNVKEFYRSLTNGMNDLTQNNAPLSVKYLVASILGMEGFDVKKPIDMNEGTLDVVRNTMWKGLEAIEKGNWKALSKHIDTIKGLLKIDPDKDPTYEPEGGSVELKKGELDDLEKALHGDVFGCGQGDSPMEGGSSTPTSPLAMQEQSIQHFRELLNVKERKVINNGTVLDTDKLISYLTGDIQELFKEEKVVKVKKSKILFLLDASGSMSSPLIDGIPRWQVVASCVKKLTEILDEVSALEGINVSWEVGEFEHEYNKLDPKSWYNDYRANGGTDLRNSFNQALDSLLKDYTIDGRKIIIAFTDGDVDDNEIIDIKKRIIASANDVRALIIAVGSDIHGKIVTEIVGNNVIVAQDNADDVLLKTIEAIL